ncbi:hypothetical protein GN958_ATG05562 [Phytophthora infestans]|uniref:Uncharacterized protein n=1 Tax=Phytophthora infestans TaxID=4787 RepID=A0A8S9UX72_PHYIN|nr:hypothetical protein GN958_ATG05562 [Phytophthora infestans]
MVIFTLFICKLLNFYPDADIMTPGEISKYAQKNLSQEANGTLPCCQTESQQKRKRKLRRRLIQKSAHTAKRQKKKLTEQPRGHAMLQQPLGIDMDCVIAGASSGDAQWARDVGVYRVRLLQQSKLKMLDYVTHLLVLEPLGGSNRTSILTKTKNSGLEAKVLAGIRSSQMDLSRELADVVESLSYCRKYAYSYSSEAKATLSEKFGYVFYDKFLDETKRYLQDFVTAVRRSRRTLNEKCKYTPT